MGNTANEINKSFGRILKDLIVEKEVSQQQVAQEIGVSESTISGYANRIESLEEHSISHESLRKLANFFDVTIEYFYGESATIDKHNHDDKFTGKHIGLNTETIIEACENTISNSLVEIFEDAIDKYRINHFIDCDFSYAPFYIKDRDAILEFVIYLRNTLFSFRRNQGTIRKYIIDFINKIEEYVDYLGEEMICDDDGVKSYRLRNIDFNTFNKRVLSFRRQLNEIYGLITDGGTLSVF